MNCFLSRASFTPVQIRYVTPDAKLIDPSNCVDMDCDARRKLMVTDLDGSTFGKAGIIIIPKSEHEWGGEKAFGLG